MSRAYRISVQDTVRTVVRAEDYVSSRLEMLGILPPDQMAELLGAELVRAGFERDGDTVTRTDGDIKVVVDLKKGIVMVRIATECEVSVTARRSGTGWDDSGPTSKSLREKLKQDLTKDLDENVSTRQRALQKEVTDRLEGRLADLRRELDQAANRATAEALKQKAAQIGRIKELTEDPQSGSLTIVVEV